MSDHLGTFWRLVVVSAIAVSTMSHAADENTAGQEGPAKLSRDVPHPISNPLSTVMLEGAWVPEDPQQIDFENLPRTPAQHAVVSDVRGEGGKRVNQHAYLVHYDGLFWTMWSDGPGISRGYGRVPGHDQPGQRVSFATSKDGLNWCDVQDLSGPPEKGFGYIARGFWQRDGELLALASHFYAPGYRGRGLSLEAFRWNRAAERWESAGTVQDDAMNNFPPKRLPNGEWMMSRRDHRGQVTVMVGGVKAIDQWKIMPLSYGGKQRPEEPYWYVLPDGKNLVGLFRDGSGSKRLLRAFSTDNGWSWSKLVRTDFPDATSKFFAMLTSRGYYAMVSNANPRRRDPLTLAISQDGLVYTHLFYLVGGRHVDYPHMIEHDGRLLIAFSGAKQTMEVLRVSLNDVDELIAFSRGKRAVEVAKAPLSSVNAMLNKSKRTDAQTVMIINKGISGRNSRNGMSMAEICISHSQKSNKLLRY
ncbi:MAG: exo-alpha-sialidase [Planctomycetes bacterium]|nr:exo-alpha-sialidase [Planctomycetota bacterium]